MLIKNIIDKIARKEVLIIVSLLRNKLPICKLKIIFQTSFS